MKKTTVEKKKRHFMATLMLYRGLMFWPLIVAGGRLVARVFLNIWDMLEV